METQLLTLGLSALGVPAPISGLIGSGVGTAINALSGPRMPKNYDPSVFTFLDDHNDYVNKIRISAAQSVMDQAANAAKYL